MIIRFAVLSSAEEGGYVALHPETGTASQGETTREALANLTEATELYLEEFPQNVTPARLHSQKKPG
jgi:predicted RNase H-like HicB family nuclease